MKINMLFVIFLSLIGSNCIQAMEQPPVNKASIEFTLNTNDLVDLATIAAATSIPEPEGKKGQQSERLSQKRPVEIVNTTPTSAPQKRYSCGYPNCTHTATLKKDLELHIWRHLKLRPYKCPAVTCDKNFDEIRNLQSHIAKAHRALNLTVSKLSEEERKKIKQRTAPYMPTFDFICEKCDQSFESEPALVCHRCRSLSKESPYKKMATQWRL